MERFLRLFFDLELIGEALPPILAEGLLNTLFLAIGSTVVGLACGLLLSLLAISRRWWLRTPARVYIDIFRGLPAILTIVLIGVGLPSAGLDVFGRDTRLYGILALGLIATAYIAEIFRAGIQSIDDGQMEAARSVGMTYSKAMRLVVIPQAFRRVLPPLTNEFIAITKDSSLIFVLGASLGERDIYRVGQNIGQQTGNFSPYVAAGLCYLLITIPLTRLVNYLDRRLREGKEIEAEELPASAGVQA